MCGRIGSLTKYFGYGVRYFQGASPSNLDGSQTIAGGALR